MDAFDPLTNDETPPTEGSPASPEEAPASGDGETPLTIGLPASSEGGPAHEETQLELDALRSMLSQPARRKPKPRKSRKNRKTKPKS